jgi:DNA polymerase V
VLEVFAHTSRFRNNYYSNGVTISLPVATQDTAELLFYAMHGAEAIYRPGHVFSKAGVLLLELQRETLMQGHLFEQRDTERSKLLMATLDDLNRQFGARTVQYASVGLKKGWGIKQERRSSRWTTAWDELYALSPNAHPTLPHYDTVGMSGCSASTDFKKALNSRIAGVGSAISNSVSLSPCRTF